MEPASPWIVLAHLLRPQGRKGELLADLFTDFPERFESAPRVWLAPPGFTGSASEAQAAEVASFWLPVGRNAGRIVLHLAGVDSIEQAERLAGREVLVPIAERLPLEDDAAYVSDLVGCTVWDRDRVVGVIAEVHFPATPDGLRRLEDAAPLLVVTSVEGDELLIPFARAFIVAVDVPEKCVRMTLPEGLVDINRSPSAPE